MTQMADPTPLSIDIRPVSLENLARFRDLLRLCLNPNVEANYFQWKYLDNPAGQVVAFEAVHEGTIAGFYGMIPQRFRIANRVVKLYQSMDTMTHPNYQRRGLFVKLAQATYRHIEETEGALHALGIPGPTSYPGLVGSLKWVPAHYFPHIMAPAALLELRALWAAPVRLHTVDWQQPEPLQWVLDRLPQLRPVVPYWDIPTLHWRVAQHPLLQFKVHWIEHAGQPIGFVVTRSIHGRCFVEWLELTDTTLYTPLMPGILRALVRAWKAPWLFTWEPNVEVQARAYRAIGMFTNPFGRGPLQRKIPLCFMHKPDSMYEGMDLGDPNLYAVQPLVQD